MGEKLTSNMTAESYLCALLSMLLSPRQLLVTNVIKMA